MTIASGFHDAYRRWAAFANWLRREPATLPGRPRPVRMPAPALPRPASDLCLKGFYAGDDTFEIAVKTGFTEASVYNALARRPRRRLRRPAQ